jgi:hypothetical protein
MIGVIGLARIVQRYFAVGLLEAWLAAWLLVHLSLVATLLLGSAAHLVNATLAWAWFGSTVLLFPLSFLFSRARPLRADPYVAAAFLPFAAVLGLMIFRSLLYLDNTYDGQTYGLVRIALWANYSSVLDVMPTVQLNVFTNEWHGELIALLYGFARGSIHGFQMTGIEQLIVTFVAGAWFARRLGASPAWSVIAATVVATMPATLGVASVLKGDLLACAALLMAAGWLLTLSARPAWSSTWLVLSLALATSSKLTVAVGAVGIAVLAIVVAAKSADWRKVALGSACGAGLSAVLAIRFLLNAVIYGNPIQRVESERIQPGIDALVGGLEYLADMLVDFAYRNAGEPVLSWALSGGAGLAVVYSVLVLCVRKKGFGTHTLAPKLAIVAAISTIGTLSLLPAHPWSLRYVLPMLSIVIICAIASVDRRSMVRAMMVAGALIAIALDARYVVMDGELNGHSTFADMVEGGMRKTPIELSSAGTSFLDAYFVKQLGFDSGRSLTIGVLAELDRPVAPLIGSRAQNRLLLAADFPGLVKVLKETCPDFAVVTKRQLKPLPDDQTALLVASGYILVAESPLAAFAQRSSC